MDIWRAMSGETLFRSARLGCALARFPGALVCKRAGETLLAIPCAEDAPFPLPELFCLARIAPVQGRRCVVYRIDEKKVPMMWENANYVYHLGEKHDILPPTNEEKRGHAR